MNIDIEIGHVISGFVGAVILYALLCWYHGDDDDVLFEDSELEREDLVRKDPDESFLEIEDLLDENSPLTEDHLVEGNYLWWGEPYIADDQKVLGLLYEAVILIQAQGLVIDMLKAAKPESESEVLSPFPVLNDVVDEPVVPVAEVTETTHEASAPNWSLAENKSEVETKLAPKDTGRPLSSPYDAWMFPKKN